MSLRLFAAIAMPDEIKDRLTHEQTGLPGADWRPRENLHLTLRYFGDMPEDRAEDLDHELAAIHAPPFSLRLKGAGRFGGADPHAVWAGIEPSPPLERLASACEKAARRAGLQPEKRQFTPHVTLAYLQGVDLAMLAAYEQRLALFKSAEFTVREFALYASWPRRGEPNIYQMEASYPLA